MHGAQRFQHLVHVVAHHRQEIALRPLRRLQVWAPSQRHEIDLNGAVKIAGSGLSDTLSERDLFERTPAAEAEKIAAMLCVKDFSSTLFVAMATRDGVIKKTALVEYESATRDGGIRGIKLNERDALVGCVLGGGSGSLWLVRRSSYLTGSSSDRTELSASLIRSTGLCSLCSSS